MPTLLCCADRFIDARVWVCLVWGSVFCRLLRGAIAAARLETSNQTGQEQTYTHTYIHTSAHMHARICIQQSQHTHIHTHARTHSRVQSGGLSFSGELPQHPDEEEERSGSISRSGAEGEPRFVYNNHAMSLGLARTIHIQCIYGILGREITKFTAIYSVYIRFRPTLHATWFLRLGHSFRAGGRAGVLLVWELFHAGGSVSDRC